MNGEARRRHELAEFLRARRKQLVRTEFGLSPVGGRTTGLRREEVCYLSSVSITWYTWLEQGRKIKPSRQVLDALACALRMSATEHAYVMSLAGYSAPQPVADPIPQKISAHVQRLLDALVGLPAYAIAADWSILGWNRAFAAAYPNVASAPAADRNLLWLVFTDPYLRELQFDWEFYSSRHLAEFRAEAGPRLGEPSFSRLVGRLLEASEPFRAGWENHDIERFTSRERLYRHPVVGDLHLELHRLALSDDPDLHVVIYTPVLATDSPERLRRLLDGDAFADPLAGSRAPAGARIQRASVPGLALPEGNEESTGSSADSPDTGSGHQHDATTERPQ